MTSKIKFYAKRENGNLLKDDNLIAFKNRWVVRDEDGNYVDHGTYSNDLRAKFNTKTTELVVIECDGSEVKG